MSLKILIVEDELTMMNTEKSFFEMRGHTVLATPKGEDALEIIEKESPEAIILDLQLDGSKITGIEVLKQTRQKHPDIKIIITTGYGKDDDIRKLCMSYNPHEFLDKPISLSKLSEVVAKYDKK